MQYKPGHQETDDIDLIMLGHAVWRAKWWIIAFAIAAGMVTFIGLSMVRPLYTSEARILIQNDTSAYRRPTTDQNQPPPPALDAQAIQSQVQVLTSRNLVMRVVKKLDLVHNQNFQKDAGIGLVTRLMRRLGITHPNDKSEAEKAADALAKHLSVYQLDKSSVIAVDYTSGDPTLAAKIANALSQAYINWQRSAKLEQTRTATSWLDTEIRALRQRVAKAEAAVERFRTEKGIYAGTNNTTLTSQQLSELNSQLILAKAQKSEAEARARLIKQMLAKRGDIDAMPEVLKSPLIGRLIEQRVQVQRQLAELSATLLPSHPRIKQLKSELADVRAQIRNEANKIVQGLENEAQVASARESSLANSLTAAKSQASGQGAAEIELHALEREAKADRDLLDSYLARYRDASTRHELGAVPADADIVSNAYAPLTPSFPRRGPITLLVMTATVILGLAFVLARELIGASAAIAAPAYLDMRPMPPLQRDLPPEPPLDGGGDPGPTPPSGGPGGGRGGAGGGTRVHIDEPASRQPFAAKPYGEAVSDATSAAGSSESLVDRIRRENRFGQSQDESAHAGITSGQARPMRNAVPPLMSATGGSDDKKGSDLDRYLRDREETGAARPDCSDKAASYPGPLVKNLNLLCKTLSKELEGRRPRAVLIAPISAANALPEAIQIARNLVTDKRRAVLVDIGRSEATVSDFLGLKRSPGFTELAAGTANFEDVVHIDPESALQIIPAGSPDLALGPRTLASFLRIFDALSQTYDTVVIYADTAQAQAFEPAMQGLLTAMVALFAPSTFETEGEGKLADFAALDCPILLYERKSRGRFTGMLRKSESLAAQ